MLFCGPREQKRLPWYLGKGQLGQMHLVTGSRLPCDLAVAFAFALLFPEAALGFAFSFGRGTAAIEARCSSQSSSPCWDPCSADWFGALCSMKSEENRKHKGAIVTRTTKPDSSPRRFNLHVNPHISRSKLQRGKTATHRLNINSLTV